MQLPHAKLPDVPRETRTSTKALTDELMRMQEDVSTLQSETAPMVKRLDLAEEKMAEMTNSIARIDRFGARIQAWGLSETEHRNDMQLEVDALKNDVRTLHNTIDRIFAIVKDADSGSGSGSGSGDDEDPGPFATATQALSPPSLWTEEERASMIQVSLRREGYGIVYSPKIFPWQGLVRYFMHRAMNMLDHQDSPPTPLTDGRFWTVDDVESASRFLRPHWDSWGPNASAWFREIVQKIIANGPADYGAPTPHVKEFYAGLKVVEVETAVKTHWQSLRNRWRLLNKPKKERKTAAAKQRRTGRKATVSTVLFTSNRDTHSSSEMSPSHRVSPSCA